MCTPFGWWDVAVSTISASSLIECAVGPRFREPQGRSEATAVGVLGPCRDDLRGGVLNQPLRGERLQATLPTYSRHPLRVYDMGGLKGG